MLEEIRITSLGVIDASSLELGPGLTVITGETGAGKTMIVTALGLLLGGRADSGAVRAGAKQARVEGVISVAGLPGVAQAVDEAGGQVEHGSVVLARNVSAEGRSRAYVGGASVPVSTLAGVSGPLVAVHGQSDQHRLLQARAQREALDAYGGAVLTGLRTTYRELYDELASTERELTDVLSSTRERAREADLLRFGLSEVEALDPQPGEDLALSAEESRLGSSDTLLVAAEVAREGLSSDTGSSDALTAVAQARTALESVRRHDGRAGELADRLAEITYLLSDAAADVASYAAGIESDPNRLAAVSQRRAALTSLTRKYGESIEEVLAWCQSSAVRLLDLDDTGARIETLRGEQARLRTELAQAADQLSSARSAAAARLGEVVGTELAMLAMPHARVVIDVRQVVVEVTAGGQTDGGVDGPGAPLRVGDRLLRFSRSGLDEVEFLLAANIGAGPRPLDKGASGGELSRVMLALEVALAETSPVPTFVFDEVDAGVGGAAAVEIGRRLAQLARTAQVLVVTHLPQVAAYADHHVVVEKSDDGTVTSSGLTVLDDSGRERELSRMLAGLADSDTGLAHARELLDVAEPARALS